MRSICSLVSALLAPAGSAGDPPIRRGDRSRPRGARFRPFRGGPRKPVQSFDCRQRLGLSSALVEGQHQLRPQVFTVWMTGDKSLQFAHQFPMWPERQVGVDTERPSPQHHLGHLGHRRLCPWFRAEFSQRIAAAQAQSPVQGVARGLRVGGDHASGFFDQPLEQAAVELIGQRRQSGSRRRSCRWRDRGCRREPVAGSRRMCGGCGWPGPGYPRPTTLRARDPPSLRGVPTVPVRRGVPAACVLPVRSRCQRRSPTEDRASAPWPSRSSAEFSHDRPVSVERPTTRGGRFSLRPVGHWTRKVQLNSPVSGRPATVFHTIRTVCSPGVQESR